MQVLFKESTTFDVGCFVVATSCSVRCFAALTVEVSVRAAP